MTQPEFRSAVDILAHRAAESPDDIAFYGKKDGSWSSETWKEVADRSRRIACGLLALGVEPQSRCAILAVTSPDWIAVDFGILGAGAATTTIYTSNTAEECEHILVDSGTTICFVDEPMQAEKLLEVKDHLPQLQKIIWMFGDPPSDDDWMMSIRDLEEMGRTYDAENPEAYERVQSALSPGHLATLIYTSGTTGKPKGVMLNHSCWIYEANAIAEIALLKKDDKHYLFLPLAHSFAKVLEMASVRIGTPTVVNGDINALVENLGETNPTVMAAVPRVFEKVYNKVVTGAEDAGGAKLAIFNWAVGVGKKVSALRQRGMEPSGLLGIQYRLADKLVYSKLKDRFGGRIRFFISGGAPLARDMAEFFHAADILILEGYGLTESSAATFVNRIDNYRFGTVGIPLPGTQVKIAEDGEILVNGGGVMQGYYNLPESTASTLTEEGWLMTGDIGEVDTDGFLRITDRKKDIIVTAGGKNIAPQVIENRVKMQTPLVSQVVMLGDKRPYCIALVTINEETVGAWAQEKGIQYSSYEELANDDQVERLVWEEFLKVNQDLASYESIKKIKILPADFTIETGELTPKMSIKRPVVARKYAELVEGIYEGSVATLG